MTLKEFIVNCNHDNRAINVYVGKLYNNATEVCSSYGRNIKNNKVANYYIEEMMIYNLFGHNQNNTPYYNENYSIDIYLSKKEKINDKELKENTYKYLEKVNSEYLQSGLTIPQIF